MGPYFEVRQKGSSTPEQVLPYRTFIFNQVVGDPESSSITVIYRRVQKESTTKPGYDVKRKMKNELDFTHGEVK
jgi:hypothetical protein